MNESQIEFLGGPRDGAELPEEFLNDWAVGQQFTLMEDSYRFEELADGRRVARFLGYSKSERST